MKTAEDVLWLWDKRALSGRDAEETMEAFGWADQQEQKDGKKTKNMACIQKLRWNI